MNYPEIPNYEKLVRQLGLYSQLQHEYGTKGIAPLLAGVERILKSALVRIQQLPVDQARARQEPNDLRAIRQLRPSGPRRLWNQFDSTAYRNRIEGALLGRMAGCTLGAAVEGWPIEKMEDLARKNKDSFPPRDYWRAGIRETNSRLKMDGVPTDDDIAYTLLGLLVVEEFGPGFSIEDNGKAWLKYLPHACTAEDIALKNLKAGVPATRGIGQFPPTE